MGSLYRGYCYASPTDAAYAWCNDLALSFAADNNVATAITGGSGAGETISLTRASIGYASCSAFAAPSGNTLSVTRSYSSYGSGLGSTSTSSGFTAIPGASQTTATTSATSAVTLRFADCDGSQSDADQIVAINSLFGPALGALAVAWGLRWVLRLLRPVGSSASRSDSGE